MAIATLADYQKATGSTAASEQITFALAAAEETLKQELGTWLLQSTTLTEFYQGTGRQLLVLRHRPVTSITTVHVDETAAYGFASGSFGSSTLLTQGRDYALDITSAGYSRSGLLRRIGDVWRNTSKIDGNLSPMPMDGAGNIRVVYVAGMATIPDDIKMAHILMTRALLNSIKVGGTIQSQSLDYYSYTLASDAEAQASLTSAKRILSRYKEHIL